MRTSGTASKRTVQFTWFGPFKRDKGPLINPDAAKGSLQPSLAREAEVQQEIRDLGRPVALSPEHNKGTSIVHDVEKRIEQLETQAAEAALLAKLAGEPATRIYNALQAEDLRALASTLRAPKSAPPV